MMRAARTLPPAVRSERTRALNRTVLALLGALLLLGGAAGLAAGLGAFGSGVKHDLVLPPSATRYADTHRWVWPAVGAAGFVLAVLALAWLVTQLRSERVRRVDLSDDSGDGRTVVDARAVTDAVEDEIICFHGVDSATARLTGRRGSLALHVNVGLDGRADLAEVRSRIENETLPHARTALDAPDLPVRIDLGLAPTARHGVH